MSCDETYALQAKIRVLYIEDHAETRELLTMALSEYGFEVLSASSVADGLSLGSAEQFDILLSDIELPDGHGWDVLQGLRAKKSFGAIAFGSIAMTGQMMESTHLEIVDRGFDRFFLKPVKLPAVISAVEELFRDQSKTDG